MLDKVGVSPSKRPQGLGKADIVKILEALGLGVPEAPFAVGFRHYYQKSFKTPYGHYACAIYYINKEGGHLGLNATTVPSSTSRRDKGGKGTAVLCTKQWFKYKYGLHKGETPAFVDVNSEVYRDGMRGRIIERGDFGINIHGGGVWHTHSLGCQTHPPAQLQMAFDHFGLGDVPAENNEFTLNYVVIDWSEAKQFV